MTFWYVIKINFETLNFYFDFMQKSTFNILVCCLQRIGKPTFTHIQISPLINKANGHFKTITLNIDKTNRFSHSDFLIITTWYRACIDFYYILLGYPNIRVYVNMCKCHFHILQANRKSTMFLR